MTSDGLTRKVRGGLTEVGMKEKFRRVKGVLLSGLRNLWYVWEGLEGRYENRRSKKKDGLKVHGSQGPRGLVDLRYSTNTVSSSTL